jgi:hypothetical protein
MVPPTDEHHEVLQGDEPWTVARELPARLPGRWREQ